MTIAINAKIHEGIVLASDSATTLMNSMGNVINVYDHANKIFNLHKGLPIGLITYGLGNIGHYSIATLAKDFRAELATSINSDNYRLVDIANRFSEFIKAKYDTEFNQTPHENKPVLGFVIAGYSSGIDLPEEYQLIFPNTTSPVLIRPVDEVGLTWNGEIEPLTRLILGFSNNTFNLTAALSHLFKGTEEMNQYINAVR